MTHNGYGIKPLTTTRIPGDHIILAARARLSGDRGTYRESWRVASTTYAHTVNATPNRTQTRTHWTAEGLWIQVDAWTGRKGLTFMWTYDLSWTARVTNLLGHLPRMGWRLDALSLNPGAPWMVFRRGDATLKVVDLKSIWPHTLERIAQWFGLGIPTAPTDTSADAYWLHVITADRTAMETATYSYLRWIQENELGSLAVTGNTQAFNAFRRRFMAEGILVHNDPELYELERAAMWTGRAEAYWHGSVLRQNVDEWDFSSAYTNLCATEPVPVFPQGSINPKEDLTDVMPGNGEAILAEVEVETDVPSIPVRVGGQILWPIGSFRTVLWTPELRVALDTCRSVRLIRGERYRTAYALYHWGQWILAQLGAEDEVIPAWLKDILKRWGNILVGRFGMRYPQWSKVGHSEVSDVYMSPGWDLDSGDEWALMQVGHEMWLQTGTATPRYSAPMITGYVMSLMRAKLWRLIEAMPPQSLLYVDTDAVLTTDRFRRDMASLASWEMFAGLRLKRSWHGMAIYGPRQLVTGESVRVAGIPKSANRTDRHDFEGEVTESFEQAIATRSTDAVRLTTRQWHVEGTDPRRRSDGYGWTWPHTVDLKGE